MPYVTRADKKLHKNWEFDTRKCIDWFATREHGEPDSPESQMSPIDEAKLRERAAVAGLREYDLAEKQGYMVHVGDIAKAIEGEYAVVKSRLRAIPGRLAQPLSLETEPRKVELTIKKEIDSALDLLSSDAEGLLSS